MSQSHCSVPLTHTCPILSVTWMFNLFTNTYPVWVYPLTQIHDNEQQLQKRTLASPRLKYMKQNSRCTARSNQDSELTQSCAVLIVMGEIYSKLISNRFDKRVERVIFTARAYARAVLEVVILSVCLSVTRVHCDKTKWRTADIFIPHERAITLLLWYGDTKSGWWAMPLPSEICAQSDPPPFEKRQLRPISAHNVSTVGDSEKSFEYKSHRPSTNVCSS